MPRVSGAALATRGTTVTKTGAATGRTTGEILDASYCDSVVVNGRTHVTPRQLLIRSTDDTRPFAAAGDSGALILTERNEAVGLLWGATCRGDGVACPIGPALRTLDLTLDCEAAPTRAEGSASVQRLSSPEPLTVHLSAGQPLAADMNARNPLPVHITTRDPLAPTRR